MAEQYYDPFSAAPPGHSLTEDNSKWPWGRPPEIVDPDEALDRAIESIMEPKNKQELFKLLMVGVSVEVIVEGFLIQAFQEGKFSPDVAVLIKPVIGLVIADMAEDEGIPFRMFENNDAMEKGKMDDRTFFRMMRQNNPRMFEYVREKMNAQIRQGMAPKEAANFLDMEEDK